MAGNTPFTGFSYKDEGSGCEEERHVEVGGRFVPYLGPNRHSNVTNTMALVTPPDGKATPVLGSPGGGANAFIVEAALRVDIDGNATVRNRK